MNQNNNNQLACKLVWLWLIFNLDSFGTFTVYWCRNIIFHVHHCLDRRDSLKRATNISLVDVAEPDDGEPREMVMSCSQYNTIQ